MSKNVHIVPHMHWDREWYFTTEESQILLVNNMEEILSMLEQNDDYPYYVLDGQTAILEDYFAVKPEHKDRVKNLVEQGKLIVGPWYTQTDEMVVGGESIVRNLLYGLQDSRKLGEPMMIGYLPDSFGQSEKMPQILNGFGIQRCIFWRGASQRHGSDKHNFYWKSDSQGQVLVHLMPLGYAIGKYLPADADALKKRMDKYLPVLDQGAVNEEILLPNGHDQMPIQKNIDAVMAQLCKLYPDREFFLSRYEAIFEKLEQEHELDTLQGELLDGKYMRVHRSIFSTRADLKSANTRIENKITNLLEPLASLAHHLGFSYEHGLIEAIWKEIMKNHAHDSIGCCCSDNVHQAIANRFFAAESKTDALITYYKRKIVDAMPCNLCLDKLTVFNLLPYERTGVIQCQITTKMKNFVLADAAGNVVTYTVQKKQVVDAGLVDRQIVHYGDYDPFVCYDVCLSDTVPAMGYKTYLIREQDGVCALEQAREAQVAENCFYKISVNHNGSLCVVDKTTGNTYDNVLSVEDGSDDGDEYDFSPLQDDFVITSKDVQAQSKIAVYDQYAVIDILFSLKIPQNLDGRKAKCCDSTMDVHLTVTIKANSPILEVQAELDNRSCDHRVRLLIPNGMATQFSISDNQFGSIKRPVVDTAMAVWEQENWDERPDAIYPMLSYVSTANETGLAVLTNSVREFEIVGQTYDTIAVTLFRSVGLLGKENLVRRPGRPSGIKMQTPDSQMLGKHTYRVALVHNCACLAQLAKEYTTPFVTYHKMPYNAMKLNPADCIVPYEYSILETKAEGVVLSAFKKAETQDGYVLRMYQSCREELCVPLESSVNLRVQTELNLNEDPVAQAADNTVLLPRNVAKTYYLN